MSLAIRVSWFTGIEIAGGEEVVGMFDSFSESSMSEEGLVIVFLLFLLWQHILACFSGLVSCNLFLTSSGGGVDMSI